MKLRKVLFSLLACMLSVMLAFAFTACDSNRDPKVDSVKLDMTTVTLGPGDTQRLKATVTLADGTEGEVEEWTSSDEKVATVTRGVIAAKAAGTATVTAKAGDKTATCAVTVEKISVELNKTTLSLERGSEETLTATVKKNDAAVATEKVDWTSSEENIATVDENGKVTALREGTTTITATRHGANQKATCEVTVTWTKPAGYEAIAYYEQNKVPTNKWGYWNDPANYVGGKSEMIEAYYQTSTAGSEAGKINFTFRVDERDGGANNSSIIQITYRSAKEQEGGKLEVNHNYKLEFTLTSSVAGKIEMNTIGKDPKPEATDIVAGDNNICVEFRHGDWGVIYPEGNYNNVESAAFILLGLLGAPGEIVNVSMDKFKWTDLGEATEKTEKPDFSTAELTIPDLSATAAIAVTMDKTGTTEADKYTITPSNEGKTQNVVYSGVTGGNYANVAIDLTGTNAKNCNMFAVTIKNNGTSSVGLRFDVACAKAIERGDNKNSKDCAIISAATEGKPSTDTVWDGTTITIEAGKETTLYIKYDPATDREEPTQLLIYFETHYWENSNDNPNRVDGSYSGNVTFSNFKFANVTD